MIRSRPNPKLDGCTLSLSLSLSLFLARFLCRVRGNRNGEGRVRKVASGGVCSLQDVALVYLYGLTLLEEDVDVFKSVYFFFFILNCETIYIYIYIYFFFFF